MPVVPLIFGLLLCLGVRSLDGKAEDQSLSQTPDSPETEANRFQSSVFKIRVWDQDRPATSEQGTAFVIYSSGDPANPTLYFLTAAHVILGPNATDNYASYLDGVTRIEVRYGAGESDVWEIDKKTLRFPASWESTGKDLAVFKVTGAGPVHTFKAIPIAKPLKSLQSFVVLGFREDETTVSHLAGKIEQPAGIAGPTSWIQADVTISHGMSGGPALSRYGVFALAQGHHEKSAEAKWLVPIDRTFLEGAIGPEFNSRDEIAHRVGKLKVNPERVVFQLPLGVRQWFDLYNAGSAPIKWDISGAPDHFTIEPIISTVLLCPTMGTDDSRCKDAESHHRVTLEYNSRPSGLDAPDLRLTITAIDPDTSETVDKKEVQITLRQISGFGFPGATSHLLEPDIGPFDSGDFPAFANTLDPERIDRLVPPHGSLYYSHQNGALNARNFFAFEKPKSVVHNFGFSMGGPLARSVNYGYVSYDGFRDSSAVSSFASTPTPATLATARAVLSANSLMENPLSTNLLQFFPAPNRSGNFNNLSLNTPTSSNQTRLSFRADYVLGRYSNHTVSSSYDFLDLDSVWPGNSPFIQFRTVSEIRNQSVSVALASRLGKSKSNSLTFSFQRNNNTFHSADDGFDANSIGLNTGVTDPRLFGLSSLTITGFAPLGGDVSLPSAFKTKQFELGDGFGYSWRRHKFYIGFRYARNYLSTFNDFGARGRISFDGSVYGNPLVDFLAGSPSGNTTILRGNTNRQLHQNTLALQFSDDLTVTKNLDVTLGLRFDFNGVPKEEENRLSNFIPNLGLVSVGTGMLPRLYDNNLKKLGPVVAMRWDPLGKGRLVVNLGWTLYFYRLVDLLSVVREGPWKNSVNPGAATNPIGIQPVFVIRPQAPIPFGIGVPIFGAGSPTPPFDIFAVDRGIKASDRHRVNASLEMHLPKELTVDLSYTGDLADNLPRVLDINQPTPGPRTTQDVRRPFFSEFPEFRAINMLVANASFRYHALGVSIDRHLAPVKRLGQIDLSANWTYSKSIDDVSFPQDIQNLGLERARSDFDQRHRLALNFRYEFPSPVISRTTNAGESQQRNKALKRIARNWTLFGYWVAASGLPYTPILSFDNSGTSSFVDRPNIVGNPRVPKPSPDQFVNAAAFQIPPSGILGNAGRNILQGPGFDSVDLSLSKRIQLNEKIGATLRWDVYDVLNRPNFGRLNTTLDNPNFGTLTSTVQPRQGGNRVMQIGIQFSF